MSLKAKTAIVVGLIAVVIAYIAIGDGEGSKLASTDISTSSPSVLDATSPASPTVAGRIDASADLLYETVTDTVQSSVVVAEVTVDQVEASRYNTTSGDAPPGDFDVENAGFFVVTPVILSAAEYYKTDDPSVVGFTVPELGGDIGGIPMRFGAPMGFEPGMSGIVFLSPAPPEIENEPYVIYLADRAASLGEPPGDYRSMAVAEWYRFSGSDAVGWRYGDTMTQTELVDQIQSAVGN